MYVFMSWEVFNTSRSKKIRIQNSRQLLNCGQYGHSPLCLIFYSLLLILVFRLTYSNLKTLKIPWALLLKPSLTHGDLTVNYFLISSFTAASQNLVELPTLKDRNYRKNSNISLELQSYQASEIQRLYKSAASASLPSVSHAFPGDSQEMWSAQPPLSPVADQHLYAVLRAHARVSLKLHEWKYWYYLSNQNLCVPLLPLPLWDSSAASL